VERPDLEAEARRLPEVDRGVAYDPGGRKLISARSGESDAQAAPIRSGPSMDQDRRRVMRCPDLGDNE
jgi:hypothetical protein